MILDLSILSVDSHGGPGSHRIGKSLNDINQIKHMPYAKSLDTIPFGPKMKITLLHGIS